MTTTELLAKVEMRDVPKGRMKRIGWSDGYLVVEYPWGANMQTLALEPGPTYILGPNIAEEERDKILKVPYPDSLLQKLKAKHGWKSHKVGA